VRDIADGLRDLLRRDQPFAVATVVGARGSSPRPPGAAMAVTADGEALGSISGGCVEGASTTPPSAVLAGEGAVVETYGYSDDDAFAVGLTCGGTLEVLVAPADRELLAAGPSGWPSTTRSRWRPSVGGPAPLGAQLLVGPDTALGHAGHRGAGRRVSDDARGMLASGQTGDRHYGARGQRRVDDVTVFVQSFTPPPRMLVFGANRLRGGGQPDRGCSSATGSPSATPVRCSRRRAASGGARGVCEWPHRYLERTALDARP
jgi:xanthine dehydrogenase accessory factor